MQRAAGEEALEGVGAPLGEVGPEAVACHGDHALLVGDWGDGACGVVSAEGFVEEKEIGEAAADGEGALLEEGEGRLHEDKCVS